ncbi:hypothetical protein [Hymenobacter psychrotolerans]|uniref:Uncharacterized protein n=1 Tax=Hymenobacter psychrotolerans DSM 18569 TaxID=1121959 RepID=A0A1M7FWY9_9BACT|nr:hypothetical protein [Hymenobacter psychrotolerans]SHM08435.1 hypothetical protein SAMN02746009_03915 [Hymenobacter psychrotolerans DSM 18569]
MKKKLLLRVSESFALTGLGVLLLPESAAAELADLPLHTALALVLRYPDGTEAAAVASVEEIARPGRPETRTLLLTQEGAAAVPLGTEVWWQGETAGWEGLL